MPITLILLYAFPVARRLEIRGKFLGNEKETEKKIEEKLTKGRSNSFSGVGTVGTRTN